MQTGREGGHCVWNETTSSTKAEPSCPAVVVCLPVGRPGEITGSGPHGKNGRVPEDSDPGGDQMPASCYLPWPGAADSPGTAVWEAKGRTSDPTAQGFLGGGGVLWQG